MKIYPPPNRYRNIQITHPKDAEKARLEAVRLYEEVGAPDQQAFKEMALLIRELIGAFDIGISMVREKEIRCYSCVLEKSPSVPKDLGFSSHAVHQDEPLVVEDLSLDERFQNNPFVRSSTHETGFTMGDGLSRPYRFYAGFQLRSKEGHTLGALYLVDTKPRKLETTHYELLAKLARLTQAKMRYLVELHGRKKDQNALIFAEKMTAMGRLVAGVAHEINTPLQFVVNNNAFIHEGISSISEFVKYLKENTENFTSFEKPQSSLTELSKVIEKFDVDYYSTELEHALKQSSIGLKRISELVLLLKNYSVKKDGLNEKWDLNECIRYAIEITRYEWKNIIELETDTEENLPSIQCNSSEMAQVLVNLISNSIDAIREQLQKKGLEKGKIKVTSRSENGWVTISVFDNGGGIPDNIMPKLFEPFFTTKDVGKGSGQGLAISWDIIVNKHKGKLQASSDHDLGTTTFEIILPIEGH